MMLLIDGVKYELWAPPNEDEFERVVKEHAKDIFGEHSTYFDLKQKLRSKSGIGSIPDGYVIVFGDSPCWHIVEAELSSHPLYEHIVQQTSKFINGIRNPHAQREITDAIYEQINSDDFLKLKVRRAIEPTETYRFLSDLISKLPVVTIIIEKHTEGLDEALSALAHPKIKVIEFQTFVREGVSLAVHAHLFEPLVERVIVPPKPSLPPPPQPPPWAEVTLHPSYLEKHRLCFQNNYSNFFPNSMEPFELETDIGVIETYVWMGERKSGLWIYKNLAEWFKAHPELKVGDKLIIEVIEPMKRYRLRKA